MVSDGAASPGRPGLEASPFPLATTESRTSFLSYAAARRLREASVRGRAEKCSGKVACQPAPLFAQFTVCEASVSSEAGQKHQSQRKRSKEEAESQETEATLLAEDTAEENTAVSRSQGAQRTP